MRLWVGLVLVTIGEFGLLDVSDILSWSMTVGRWWPAALIAVGVAAMVTQRRVSFGPAIMTGIGVVLLAEVGVARKPGNRAGADRSHRGGNPPELCG
jgi:hypothetical protein